MIRMLARSVAMAAGVVAFAACSDPVAPAVENAEVGGAAFDHVPGHVGASQIVLVSDGSTRFCGYVDAFDSPSACTVGDPSAVDVATNNPGWTATITGADWVSFNANGDKYIEGNETGTYTYQREFTVPAGSTNIQMSVQFAADNNACAYLDAVAPASQLGCTGADSHLNGVIDVNTTTTAGAHSIIFVVNNTRVFPEASPGVCLGPPPGYEVPGYNAVDCDNPTALLYRIDVSYSTPIVGDRGCSPGYWKNHGYPNGVTPNTLFGSVGFDTFGGMTFDAVLNAGGGGTVALGRHAASAYLNAVIFGSAYGMTPAQVVAAFNAATGDAALENELSETFAGMEDVNGRTCDAGTPNTNKKK
jgi:hypothetical protein